MRGWRDRPFRARSAAERRDADRFLADLLGESGPEPTEFDDSEFLPVGRWTGPGREPFFGDEADERWKVIARPGQVVGDDLRDDDLVVYRSFKFRGSAWRCTLVADIDRDSLFRDDSERLRGDAVLLRRVLMQPAPVQRALPPARSVSTLDEVAEDQPSSSRTAGVCASDVAVTDRMALLVASKSPMPINDARAATDSAIRDDYKSVAAIVPATPERRLLIYFHGNNNYVTVSPNGGVPSRVDPSGHSRVPRWVTPSGRDEIIGTTVTGKDGKPKSRPGIKATPIKYGFESLAASQQALAPADKFTDRAVKDPVVLVPENGEPAKGGPWNVPPKGQYGTAKDGKPKGPGTKRLEELVIECYDHLRCLRNPSGRPYLSPDSSQRASWLSNVQRTYMVGHSGGGKPLVETAGADMVLITPSSAAGLGGRAVEFWLFDCTYGFGTKNYVNFCTNWHNEKLLAYRPDAARFICVYGPKTDQNNTEEEANLLRGEIATVLKVSAASLLKLHDTDDMTSRSMVTTVIPALVSSPVVFIRTGVSHDQIPTKFIPLLLRTAAS